MPQTFAEKILSERAGRKVAAGEIVDVIPHRALSHDNAAAIASTFAKIGVKKIFDPERLVFILDHCVPAADDKHAANHKKIRHFAAEQKIKNFFDINAGICHQVFAEMGFALPGTLVVGSDSHTPSAGAFNAFACGIGRSEMAVIWATGQIWLKVPETIRVTARGRFQKCVGPKDLALYILGQIGADGGLYASIEFCGPAVAEMSLGGRMVLCNLAAEMGCKNAVCPFDTKVRDYLSRRSAAAYTPLWSDEGAKLARELAYDVSAIDYQVACPHAVDKVRPAAELAGTKIDQVLLGTCTNGRLEDLRQAAQLLRGRRIHPRTRLLVFPASHEVWREASREGTLLTLSEAGGVIMNPGCGPCLGAHEGILAPGEVCLSTANRNFKGRMGCNESEVYLCSPAVAAASAIAGAIALPEEI